jgi:hypothetical protein
MKKSYRFFLILFLMAFITASCNEKKTPENVAEKTPEIPHLMKRGDVTQLMVDGKPFLILGGELHNSSSSSREYMAKFWPELQASGMNTVLAAVEWALVEPEQGKYDFKVIDNLLEDARSHNLKLILLWFGSWKNSQLHYIPDWMKKDFKNYPRVKAYFGKSLEILSPFCKEAQEADKKAFTAVMKHLKEVDSEYRTVLMMQVENEVGILGSPRDHSSEAEAAFNAAVPKELMDHIINNDLLPELYSLWETTGFRSAGTWEEVFGKGDKTDEIFMAWKYATYINDITKAGKAEYPIPMFVNAWLVQKYNATPGDYPSGGPQAHMLDIWRAGAPDVDLYCPDIYRPEFAELCALYTRSNNTLFIPEARAGELGAGQFLYAIGRHKSIGYSPFGYESRTTDNENDPMTKVYRIISGMTSQILNAQSNGSINAVLLNSETHPAEELTMGEYRLLTELHGRRDMTKPYDGYGLIINSAPDEYIIYGKNIQVSFSPVTPGPAIAGIAHADEGIFENGEWHPWRRMNGDEIFLSLNLAAKALENKAGTGIKFNDFNTKIQRVTLYRYE